MLQYVGARYVPKFFENPNGSAEWIAGVPYEAMTIATYNGNTYISKIPVPVNVDILNTKYWLLTGSYNGAILGIQNQIDAIKFNKPYVTPEEYGAKGDGVTDDTNAFIAALEANEDVILYLKHASYLISATLFLSPRQGLIGNNTTLIMSGVGNFTQGYALMINATAEDGQTSEETQGYSVIEGIKIYSTTNLNGIMVAMHCEIKNCIFDGLDKAIRFSHGKYIDNLIIENCYVRNAAITNPCIDLGTIGDARYVRNVQIGANRDMSNPGVLIYSGQHVVGADISFIIGQGRLVIEGEAWIHNCFLSFYGTITCNVNAVVEVTHCYFTVNLLKQRIMTDTTGRCRVKDIYYIYSPTRTEYATGNPFTGNVKGENFWIGTEYQASYNEFQAMTNIFGLQKDKVLSVSGYSGSLPSSISAITQGMLPAGTYTYHLCNCFDMERHLGRSTSASLSITTESEGGVFIPAGTALRRTSVFVYRSDGKIAFLPETNATGFIDTGLHINGIEWQNGADITTWNSEPFTKSGDMVVIHQRSNFTPVGTWKDGDMAIMYNKILYYLEGWREILSTAPTA